MRHLGLRAITFLVATAALATPLWGAGYVLRVGAVSLGNGGANPVGIPPGATDLEFSFIASGGFEANIGLPGLLFGYRAQRAWGGYISTGGGLVMDAHGAGPGVYSAFGADFGRRVKFNIEYKQALGASENGILSPYALRMGCGLWF